MTSIGGYGGEHAFQSEPISLKVDGVAVDQNKTARICNAMLGVHEAIVKLTPDERSLAIRAVCVLMGIEPQNKESK